MWVLLTNRVTLACLLLATGGTAIAQSDAGQAIDFNRAIAKTLASNPELRAFGFEIEAQQGRIRQSALRPAVELGVDIENATGTGNFSGIDGAEATLSLAWALERGKRQHRVDAARAGLSVLESEAELKRLEASAETARRFLEALALQARIELADEAVVLAQQTVAAVRNRVSAGRSPKADLARAEVDLSRLDLERENLDHQLRTSVRRLAAQWGESSPEFTTVRGDLAELPEPDSFNELLARIDGNPHLQRYLGERRLREAELRLAKSEAKPDWRLLAGVRHLQLTDDQALVAGITIPLGGSKRNEGNIARARADLHRSGADRAAARVRVETQLFKLYEELTYSLHRATTLRDEVLPKVETALAETQRAYELGRYSYFELRVGQDDALNARTEVAVALIDAHRNVIEIESLTGAALSSPSRQ
jgi:cobalt-zinc-cadmium efflux system outer membrane protein